MKESVINIENLTEDLFKGSRNALDYLEARGHKQIGPGTYSFPKNRKLIYKEYTVMGYLITQQGWTFQ